MPAILSNTNPATAHRPPPDYTSRRVKLRLFVTLASMMLAAAVVERTFFRSQSEPAARQERFNNRLHTEARTAHDPAGTFVSSTDTPPTASNDHPFDPIDRALDQGWKETYSHLDTTSRGLLFDVLHAATHGEALPPEKLVIAADLYRQLRKLWDDYQATATRSLTDLAESDKTQWQEVLSQADQRFQASVQPLEQLANGQSASDALITSLGELQSKLVPLARGQIQDDTPILRLPEREIWLYEFSRLGEKAANSRGDRSPTPVTYLQLSRQPADHRGQFVAIKGTVRRAYRSAATPNYLGIKDYCVYWLHPAGGPDTPLIVYALEAPPGFPKLAKNQQEATNSFREDVEITGIFFKRSAYAAQAGTYTAPLLLTGVPVWHPTAPTINIAPSSTLIYEVGGAALAALLIALCITTVLWKRSASARPLPPALSSTALVDLSNLSTAPTPTDHLRQLEQNDKGGGT